MTRHLVLIFGFISMTSAMGIVLIQQQDEGPRIPQGDWPDRFPLHPSGFSYKCKGRQNGQPPKPTKPGKPVTTTAPQQQPQRDVDGGDIISEAPVTVKVTTTHAPTTTSTHKPTTITLKQIVTTKKADPVTIPPQSGTTFWIRSPTPPTAPEKVNPNGPDYKLGDPLLVKVPIKDPFAPDAALDPLNAADGSDDFNIKTVGTPKPPRAVVDPDA